MQIVTESSSGAVLSSLPKLYRSLVLTCSFESGVLEQGGIWVMMEIIINGNNQNYDHLKTSATCLNI